MRRTALVLFALLMACCASAASVACDCFNGNIDIATPQCLCACYSGYLMPRCLYKATDTVEMHIWQTVPASEFQSEALMQTLRTSLPIVNMSSASFVYASAPTAPGAAGVKTLAVVKLLGQSAQQLLWDFYSNNSWVTHARIEGVYENVPLPAPRAVPGDFKADAVVLYDDKHGTGIIVTLSMIMWFVGFLLVALFLWVFESCCFANTEDEVAEKMIAQQGFSNVQATAAAAARAAAAAAGGGAGTDRSRYATDVSSREATPKKKTSQTDFTTRTRL